MELLKIKIKSCKVDTYWYDRKIGKVFYAIIGKDCFNNIAYTIMQLNPMTDNFQDTLERVQLDDADIVDKIEINVSVS